MAIKVRVLGAGHYVPPRAIDNERIARAVPGWAPQRILEKTGIEERRFLWDFDDERGLALPPDEASGEPASNTDMCEVASRNALTMAGLDAADLDALFLVTCTPDELNFNHDAVAVHQRLGMRRDAFSLVVDDGCGGTPYVIDLVQKMISSGAVKTALVVASAFTSPLVNRRAYTAELVPEPGAKGLSGFLSMYVFGDAAGAVLLGGERGVGGEQGEGGSISSSMSFNAYDELVFRRGGGALKHMHQGRASDADLSFIINGPLVAKTFPEFMNHCLNTVLHGTGRGLGDVDRFYFHQPNRRVLENFAGMAGIPPEKLAMNVHRYGNTSAAGMLVLLSEDLHSGRVRFGDGQQLLLAAVGANVHAGAQLFTL